ncbi:MAG: Uma2 family endonuclease [Dehalococcoidia bacterium]
MVGTTDAPVTQEPITRRRWTREEYERMVDAGILDENDRVELIVGEIVNKVTHKGPQATSVGLGQDALIEIVPNEFHVRVQLPLALGSDSEPEPDLAVVRGSRRDYRSGHPDGAVLVIEVSDSTLALDRSWKASVYARAGIPEYWIINLVDRIAEVYRDPAPDAAALLGYGYRQRLSFGPDGALSVLGIADASVAVRDLLP